MNVRTHGLLNTYGTYVFLFARYGKNAIKLKFVIIIIVIIINYCHTVVLYKMNANSHESNLRETFAAFYLVVFFTLCKDWWKTWLIT